MSKVRGHHAYNRVHVIIEAHFPPDYFRVGTVIPPPKAVADDHWFDESRRGILRRIDAAKFRLRSQQSEVIGTGDEAFGPHGPISTADRRVTRRHRRDLLKHARALLQIPKLRR